MAATRFEAEKFSGKNDFGLWRIKMKAMLIQQGLADAIQPIDPKEKGAADLDVKDAAKKKDIADRAHSAIILSLADKVLREVSKESTAAGVWAKLESLYMTKSLANRLYMKQRLYSYKFFEDKAIGEQLDEFNKAVDDLENIDVQLEDEDKAIILLNALPKSFEHLKDAMLFGRETTITLEEVQCALKSKELQKAAVGSQETASQALNVQKFKGKKKKRDFSLAPKQHQKQGENVAKETRSCHYCKKPGHLKRDCFSWKRKQEQESKNQNTADVAEEVEVMEVLNVVGSQVENYWIMDSGCSFHICSHRNWFESLDVSEGSVLLGNDHACKVHGIGNIRLKLHDQTVKLLTDVRFIPEIKRNLISLGVLESKGYSFSSQNGCLQVSKASRIIMKAERRNSLYYLMADTVIGASCSIQINDAEMWHRRLGHPGENVLKELGKKRAIKLADSTEFGICEQCVLGKSKKLPYSTGNHTSAAPLEYAHSDLWGPSQTVSIGGGKYFISIIDDFSRKVWVYVLKEKSQAFEYFKKWCLERQSEKGVMLKCLRTDNGMEFLSNDFMDFCKLKGIRRHRTVPNNPQQNGVAERMNRTLLERVRCMLFAAGMPKIFWGEAVSTAAALINCCPSSAILNDTPNYKWYGKLDNYSRFKVFGCRAYAHLKLGKLEPRAAMCVMLGYQEGVKGYRLWCTERGKQRIMISRDVIFDEKNMPFLKEQLTPENENESSSTELLINHEAGSSDDQGNEILNDDYSGEGGAHDQTVQTSTRTRPKRLTKLPARFSDYDMSFFALCVAEALEYTEPSSYKEAMRCRERLMWLTAMREEIESLLKNGTWTLVKIPTDQKVISCKWIFKKKVEVGDVETIRYKARLVARGFTQEEGVDYNEIFSPVVKHTSIRILLALVAHHDWELQQLDVKTAFLHGDLEETIYMMQPEGFVTEGNEQKVCLLKKSLYGLRQSSRQWYIKFDEHMLSIGFERSSYDQCVYIKRRNGTAAAYLLLYVDDMLVAGASKEEVQAVKEELKRKFEMKDLGNAKRILGMDIIRNRKERELKLVQTDYINKVLSRFQMVNTKAVSIPLANHFRLSNEQKPKTDQDRKEMSSIPYANIIGSIMYTMICTRPDVAQAISVTSRYMADYGREHWCALKWIMRYLKGSASYGLRFRSGKDTVDDALEGFCDSDYASNRDNRKSQSGYIFNLYGTAISWKSNLQSVVALSTTEAEYIALTEAVKEGLWLKGIMEDFGVNQKSVSIKCDSNSAICLSKHQVFHERSKHIDVRMHFIRDEIQNGRVRVVKVSTDHNAADMLTKPLPASKFHYCLELVGMIPC